MNNNQIQKIISNNLRFYRAEAGWTQEEIARKAKISLRLYHQIENGKSNPTVDTLCQIARTYQVTVERIMKLSFFRTSFSSEEFLELYKNKFADAPVNVLVRDLDGRILWSNQAANEIIARDGSPLNDSTMESEVTNEEVLKNELNCEKRGFVMPYMNYVTEKNNRTYLRFYPTLILPQKGQIPYYASVYFSSVPADCEESYYFYSKNLLSLT